LKKITLERDKTEKLNTPIDSIIENIVENTRYCKKKNIPTIQWYPPNDKTLTLVAGGPSLNDSEEDIRASMRRGNGLACVNNVATWLMDRKLWPGAQVLLDAREVNLSMPEPHIKIPPVKYFIASQCHRGMFQLLENKPVWLWHGGTIKYCQKEILELYDVDFPVIRSGSTVVLAAFWLFYILGYRRIEVFGFDSCLKDGDHHAYMQSQNDGCSVFSMFINGREFKVHPWMAAQFEDFLRFSKHMAGNLDLLVHGDGMIAYAIKSLAETGTLNREVEINGNERMAAI